MVAAMLTSTGVLENIHIPTRRRDDEPDETQQARIKAAKEKRERKALKKEQR